jgi:hypothetical protein
MATLVTAPTSTALADMHREAAAHPPRLGQLVLILVLNPLLLDLSATRATIDQRRLELLIDLPRRLTVTMPAVLITRPPTRPTRIPARLSTRKRRRLTLPRTPRLLQIALKLPDPRMQPLVLTK